jgi:biotin operon repressor
MATWKEVGPEERYEVVQMAMTGKLPLKDLCENFGMSRTTLNKAIEKARAAATQALEPKPRGRKAKPVDQQEMEDLAAKNAALEKEVDRWKTKWEVTRTVLDLERELGRGKPGDPEGEKNKRRNERKRRRKQT